MNYSDYSDFEINRRVAELLGKFEYVSDCNHNGGSAVLCDSIRSCHEFDPCNDPSDAWPIILDNRISMIDPISLDGMWTAFVFEDESEPDVYDKNPLRAAMIVYLKMQEAQC